MDIKKKWIQGIEVNYLKATKYKHMMIVFSYYSKNDYAHFNELNILPSLLEENNLIYKTTDQLNIELDKLYGASFFSGVYQRGDLLSNQFFLKLINEKYIEDGEGLIESAFSLMHTIIYKPKMYRNLLTKQSVKEKIKETYEALDTIKQDKATLAYFNFIKKIAGEYLPVIFPLENNIDQMSQVTMTETYQQMIQNDYLKIYVIGDFNESLFDQVIEKTFVNDTLKQEMPVFKLNYASEFDGLVHEWSDMDDVSISRVYLGYHINLDRNTFEADVMDILSRIIGGDAQSKLFMSIREEMQLVYMIYSSYLYDINTFMIHFETEPKDENQAIEKTKEIVLSVKNGDISDEEIEKAKLSAVKSYKSVYDSLYGVLKLNMSEDIMSQRTFNIDERINSIMAVTKENLIALANKMNLNHVYRFVKGDQ